MPACKCLLLKFSPSSELNKSSDEIPACVTHLPSENSEKIVFADFLHLIFISILKIALFSWTNKKSHLNGDDPGNSFINVCLLRCRSIPISLCSKRGIRGQRFHIFLVKTTKLNN